MHRPIQTACEIVARLEIDQTPAGLEQLRAASLPGNWHPAEYLQRLLAQGLVRDARHFLAHAMPRRRALWWACLCAHDVRHTVEDAGFDEVLQIAARFVQWPAESTRRAAQRELHSRPLNSFSAHLAAAVFFSQGSVALPHAEPIPAPPAVLGRLVSTVVYLAATRKNIREYVHCMREYVELGREIAQGRHLWPEGDTPPTFRIDPLHNHKLPGCRGHAAAEAPETHALEQCRI